MKESTRLKKKWNKMLLNLAYNTGDAKHKIDTIITELVSKHPEGMTKNLFPSGVITCFNALPTDFTEPQGDATKYMAKARQTLAIDSNNWGFSDQAIKAGVNCILQENTSANKFVSEYLGNVIDAYLSPYIADLVFTPSFPGLTSLDAFIVASKEVLYEVFSEVESKDIQPLIDQIKLYEDTYYVK